MEKKTIKLFSYFKTIKRNVHYGQTVNTNNQMGQSMNAMFRKQNKHEKDADIKQINKKKEEIITYYMS